MFLILRLGYEPLLTRIARRRGLINRDMVEIRLAWMRAMIDRENPLTDSQLMGHALNSASFFASSNLILIAGAAGLLFGGEGAYRRIQDVPMLVQAAGAVRTETGAGGPEPGAGPVGFHLVDPADELLRAP